MNRILIIDDEMQITRMLRTALQASGYNVLIAHNGLEGFEVFEREAPDLIISDLAMPEMNGLELTHAVREVSQVPIIVLSVRNTEAMKVKALDEGADDYLTKPFSLPELLARVRVQLRRESDQSPEENRIETGDFVIDRDVHSVHVRGQLIHLTPKEFCLLDLFAQSPGRILSHKVLLRKIWGASATEHAEYLRVLIATLRKKIEGPPSQLKYIESEPWIGYRFHPTGTSQK